MRHNVLVFLKTACVFVAAGYYFTGDGAHRSKEGYYQITGRLDDVINVSGHRIGTAEIEDVLVKSISDWTVNVFGYCLLLKVPYYTHLYIFIFYRGLQLSSFQSL